MLNQIYKNRKSTNDCETGLAINIFVWVFFVCFSFFVCVCIEHLVGINFHFKKIKRKIHQTHTQFTVVGVITPMDIVVGPCYTTEL